MDVRMPDGTIITNVPDNITQSELLARYGKLGQQASERSVAEDYGRLIAAPAVSGVAGIPKGIGEAAAAIPRKIATGEIMEQGPLGARLLSKAVQLIRDAFGTSISEQEEQKLAAKIATDKAIDRASSLFELPSAVEYLAQAGEKTGKEIRAGVSPELKEKMEKSKIEGNVLEAVKTGDFSKLSFGEDPTLEGYLGQGSQVLGSLLPVIMSTIITRSPGVGGAVGGGMAAGEASNTAREYIKKQSDDQLRQASQYYTQLRDSGVEEDQARRIISDRAAENAAMLQGTVATIGSVITGKLITGQFDKVLNDRVRSRLGKIAIGGTAAAAEEGTQEFLEGIASDLGIDREVIKEIGEDSFANLILGAIGGGPVGAVRGAIAKQEKKPEAEPPPPTDVEPVITKATVLGENNTQIPINVIEDPRSGDVVATGPDGEEIDITNMLSAGMTVEEALQMSFGGIDATMSPVSEKETVAEEVAPEIPEVTTPVEQPPMPEPEEITTLRAQAEDAAKQMRRIERTERGPSLATALRNRLDSKEVFDISPEPGVASWFGRPEKRGPGERLGNIISSGELNDFLSPELVINPTDSAEVIADKEPAAEEYIKEKIRNKNYLTFDTDTRLQNLGTDFSELQNLLDREIADEALRAEANEIAAEISREEGLSPLEAAPEEGAVRDTGERPAEPGIPEEGVEFRQVVPPTPPALELVSETPAETVARQEREAAERPAREAKEIADREREVFRLEPTEAPVAPPVQQKLFDVSAKTAEPIVLEGNTTPSFTREFDRAAKLLNTGRLTPEAFAGRVTNLRQEVLNAKKTKERPARIRGADFIRQKLLEAKRNNVIDAETLELTEWFIKQNPDLVDDLGISIRQSDEVGTAGQYIPTQRIAKLIKGSIEKTTPIHEILHHLERMMPEKVQSAIQKSWLKSMGAAARKAVKDGDKNLQEFYDLILEHHTTGKTKPFEQAVKMVANGKVSYDHYQHVNPSEFWAVNASRIMSGRFDIRGDKLAALKTWLRNFTETIKDVFNLKSDAAIIRALDSLIKGDGEFVTTEMLADAPVFKSVFNKKQPKPEPTSAGREALESMDKLGRQEKADPPSMLAKAKQGWDNAVDNPKLTASESAQALTRFTDYIETKVFSSDAAANNAYRREIVKTLNDNKEIMGRLLSVSASQASHPDALANLFIRYGKLEYNPELYKYEAKEDKVNFVALAKQIDDIAKKYGLTKEEAERIAHTSFEATRLQTLVDFNERLKDQVQAQRKLAKDGSTETIRSNAAREARRLAKQFKYIHAMYIPDGVKLDNKQKNALAMEQIKEGLALKTKIPELQNLVDTWNGIRQNSVKELVDSGLWSKEEAEEMLSNAEYVPFYREEQLEKNKGPKEFLRNLQVQAKEKRLKGSQKAVADIFDNMARWTQYAVKRSVLNRLAVAKADALVEADLARKVDKKIVGKNIVSVWRDGNQEFYEVDDPLFMDAFTGLESVAIPALRPFAAISNFLRQTVVLYPLFSVSQVPQDSFAAMFTSGLKTRYALRIPVLAAKEFVKTLVKRSQTHRELEKFGAVGVRDFTAAVARNDAEIYAGLKGPPGFWGKTKNLLEHISMASDNAVRQAVYEASMQQGLSRAEGLEKAFQLINFRTKGSSKAIAAMGQVIPFFNAYLAAQHVAIKTITGRGISPVDRKEALKTLAATTGSVMVLSMIYAMLMGDDEDYENKPSVMRDRVFMVPGTKITIPIRQDIFSIPKIVSEHTYLLLADKGSTDGRKFRDSIRAALGNALFSPTVVPQAIKPVAEVIINYNFFTGRPLIGTYQKGLDVERQFNDSTSQLGRLLGGTGLISPIAVDHLVRGMFGSAGGLGLYLTNFILHDSSVPRPEMSAYEMITALPGTSGFLTKENETGLKNDFYVLRDEVAKIANTINDIEARSPEALEKYFSESKTWSQWIKLEKAVTPEAKMIRADLKRDIDRITKDLSEIRREISTISNLTDKQMSAKEKAEAIKDLRKAELEMMKSIDVRAMRALAQM